MMRATNRDVRLCNLQDLIYMAADRAVGVEDWGMYRHQMDRYARIKGNGSGNRRKPEYRALVDALRVGPVDSVDPGPGAVDHHENGVVWTGLVERGVRVNLEVRVSGDGDVHVVGFNVADVLDNGDAGPCSGVLPDPGDAPVGSQFPGGRSFSEPADEFVEPDGDEGGGDGDEDASSDTEHAAEHSDWTAVMGRLLGPRGIRLTLSGVAA